MRLLLVLLVVGGLIALAVFAGMHEASEQDYVRTHACDQVERRPGYYTMQTIVSGKTVTVTPVWHGPRGRWVCADGTEHWTNVP